MSVWISSNKTGEETPQQSISNVKENKVETPKNNNSMSKYFVNKKPEAFVTLLYGDSGSGKTYTAMTFPEPLTIIDTENRAINTTDNFKDKEINIVCPMKIKDIIKKNERPLDEHATIEELKNFMVDYVNYIKENDIKKGTIVIDSVSDLWTWIQMWGVYELSKKINKDGSSKADPFTLHVKNQLDWRLMNTAHYDIVNILRSLIFRGIHVVFTAREEKIPEHVKENATNKDRIRSQKDIPFLADTIWRLGNANGKHIAICEKLIGKEHNRNVIENLTFEKIKNEMKKEAI